MADSSDTAPDESDVDDSSTRTVSQSQFQGERLNRIEELLVEDDVDQPAFATAVVSVFNIQCSEMETYFALLEHQESTPGELADIMGGDRSGTNTRLVSLMEKDLVSRERRGFDKPNNPYEYTAKPLEETMSWMQEYIEGWSQGLVEELSTIQERFPDDTQENTT